MLVMPPYKLAQRLTDVVKTANLICLQLVVGGMS